MNKKGFTVVELITSFALSAIIITLLFSIILSIKSIYTSSAIKTEMLIEQSMLSKKMNSIINSNNIVSYVACNNDDYELCYQFNDIDNNEYFLLIDKTKKIITFDNYTYKLGNNSYIGDIIVDHETISDTSQGNNSFFYIKIPIYNKVLQKENFGINLIYPYNSNNINI